MLLAAYARPACSSSHVSSLLMLLKDVFDALATNGIIMHCKFEWLQLSGVLLRLKMLAGKCISDQSEVQSTYPLLLFD